jgi:hypothetical protein
MRLRGRVRAGLGAVLACLWVAAAAAQAPAQAFVGTWRGTQGSTVEATYVFELQDGALRGRAELRFVHPATGRRERVEGEVSAIHVHGRTISFLVTNWGGGREVDGSTAIYDLALEGDRLAGRGQNYRTAAVFDVRLARAPR